MRDKTHYNKDDNNFEIIIYESEKNKVPFLKYFEKQSKHKKAVIRKYIDLLEKKGNKLDVLYSKKIDKYIYELRIMNYGYNVRILYFFDKNRRIIITNAFDKTTNKTPSKYILLANIYRKSWTEREECNET